MDPPGFSLFQGGESIHINGANRAAEEEEEEKLEQNRRNNELGQELQTAFDDLDHFGGEDDDDETMDNSYRSGLSYSQGPNVNGGLKRNYPERSDREAETSDNVIFRLRLELQSKSNELLHVSQLLAEERQTARKNVGDLTKKLTLAEAERERMQMMKNQTHELLVESKTKICDLDDTVGKLKERNGVLEEEKSRLAVELENSRIVLNDTQMKCHMMEKEIGRAGAMNNSRQQDAAFKQLTERNNAQIEMMQQQIDNFRNKLEAKDVELRTLEAKYRDLQKTREVLLIEKSDTINNLTEKLERAQRQCQELLATQNSDRQSERTNTENAQLRNKISSLETHIEDLQKTTDGLLKQLERREDFANVMESTPHMRKKPHLAMQGLEETDALRREIDPLRKEVAEKSIEIQNLIMIENDLREQLKRVEEMSRSNGRDCDNCRLTRTHLDELIKLNKTLTDSNADLQEINERIMSAQEEDNKLVLQKFHEFRVLQQLIGDLKGRIEEMETEKVAREEKYNYDMKKMNEMAQNSVQCMLKMKEATEIEVKNIQLQSDCFGYLKHLKGLRAASTILSEVENRATSTSTSPDKERKTCCDRSVMVSTPSDSSARVTESTDLTSAQKTAIIEEYAKLSAVEIKRVEDKYRQQLFDSQQQLLITSQELEGLRKTFEEETDMFKEVIMVEREEYERLLEEKEKEVDELLSRVANLEQKSSRDQMEDELLASLEHELKKKQVEIDEERHSMMVWRNQWKEERKQLIAIERHLKKEMEVLRENCKSAKKTAANYKKYTEEKDQFINREIERMRMQYEGVIEQLRLKCKRQEQRMK